MSLTYNKTSQPLAVDTEDNSLIYYSPETGGPTIMETNAALKLMPQIGHEPGAYAFNHYIVGISGDGKSTLARDSALLYHELYPSNNIFLYTTSDESKIPNDRKVFARTVSKYTKTTYADFLNLKRTYLNQNVLKMKFNLDDYKNSLIIFDDWMQTRGSTSKETTEILRKLCDVIIDFLTTGRKLGISLIITSHLLYDLNNPKLWPIIWSEIHCLSFGKRVNKGQLRHVFDRYFNLSPKIRTKILNFDITAKMITLLRYPYLILSSNRMELIDT